MQTVVSGTLINYLIVNPQAKKDVLVLHGWGHNAGLWLETAKNLDTSYRYILLDLPGFGASQNLADHPNIPEFTQFTLSFIKKIKLHKPILLGHSFGGQIALDIAATSPNKISQLILVAPAGIRTNTPNANFKSFFINQLATTLKPVKKYLPPVLSKSITNHLSSLDYRSSTPLNREVLKKIIRYDLTHKLSKIPHPTLIVWCELDQELPNTSHILTSKIKVSRLRVLYGSNHNPHIHKIKDLTETINHYLSS